MKYFHITMFTEIIENVSWFFIASRDFIFSLIIRLPKQFWGVIALMISIVCLIIYLNRQWVQAKPNEWLLVIRSGKLAKAGVGLKTLAGPLDTIVTFPSKVQRVYFEANNVTHEMQGVNIAGFAFWSVYRDDDGPFRCYKYMQGLDPNSSVRALCESVLRNLIANSTLDQVMKNRTHLRVNMQKDLKNQFKGWGVWLESVQITEVKICSRKLFEDLQAQYRQQTNLKAQLIQLQGNLKLEQSRQNSDLRINQNTQTNETKKQQTKYKEQIKRKTQEEDYFQKNFELEIKKLARIRELQSQRLNNQHQKNREKLRNEQNLEQKSKDFEIQTEKRSLDMDKLHDDTTLKKYKIDATERIYSNIGIKDIKVNQFISDSSLLSLVPTLLSK